MRVKDGVDLDGMHPWVIIAACVYDLLRQSARLGEGTITSGRDAGDDVGAARVSNSLHPLGYAVDLRTNDLPGGSVGATAQQLARQMQAFLGAGFAVILEEDHLHVQISRSVLNAA